MDQKEESLSLREARARYLEASGLGEGGYEARWVKLQAGPIPIYFPNSPQRVRAVRLHDLHHPLTGYDTSWTGEAEIGAWEIASGCRDHYAAWGLNLGAMAIGLLIAPARVQRAFLRGCHSSNLYDVEFREELLDQSFRETQQRLGLDRDLPNPSTTDHLRFALWSFASLVSLFAPLLLILALLV